MVDFVPFSIYIFLCGAKKDQKASWEGRSKGYGGKGVKVWVYGRGVGGGGGSGGVVGGRGRGASWGLVYRH